MQDDNVHSYFLLPIDLLTYCSCIYRHGPNSNEVITKVEELDTKFGELMFKLEESGISNNINILIAADHGMK